MKKIIVLLIMLLCFCGCSSAKNEEATAEEAELNPEIVAYFDKYDCTSSMGGEEGYICLFDDGNELGTALVVKFSDAQREAYNKLIDSDDFFDNIDNLVEQSTEYEVLDLNSLKPDQSELNQYVGKTIGEIEDEGFMEWGSDISDSGATFLMQNETYSLEFYVEGSFNADDLSENDKRALTVSSVTFSGLSDDYYYTLMD